jgi:triosephosphate isomerase
MRQLIAGNWKMNGLVESLAEIGALRQALARRPVKADILVCPPATLIARACAMTGNDITIGGQDCHPEPSGAFTGDISAEMLKDAGATSVIVGHSERRQYHGETDATVAAKARAAWRAGLKVIVCIGETEAERERGDTLRVCASQLLASIPDGATAQTTAIAYEPVWAIGTGKTPTLVEIEEVHAAIRTNLATRFGDAGRHMRILYGGSVKPANAGNILALGDVNGALVGGASLKAADFLAIIEASPKPPMNPP